LEREEIHLRRVEVRAFRRADGLYDIEARMVDTKSHPFQAPAAQLLPAGERLHDIGVRLVIDEHLKVHEATGLTEAAPFGDCREAGGALHTLKGLTIGTGWLRAVRERLGGVRGCTHMVELLGPVATTAFQALAPLRFNRPEALDPSGRPKKIGSCYAYASHREVVLQRWPAFHDGPKAG
jgi:hypothetical protein